MTLLLVGILLLQEVANQASPVAKLAPFRLRTPLQQIQIVKGWVGKHGPRTHEKVFTVAGGENVIEVVEVCFFNHEIEQIVTAAVWSDPNQDGEPFDGVLLRTSAATATASGSWYGKSGSYVCPSGSTAFPTFPSLISSTPPPWDRIVPSMRISGVYSASGASSLSTGG